MAATTVAIQRAAKDFSRFVLNEVIRVYSFNGLRGQAMMRNISRWSNTVGQRFYRGIVGHERTIGYGRFREVRNFQGIRATFDQFTKAWGQEIVALSSKDLATANMLARNLERRFGSRWEKFYDEYETYSKLNLGKPLYQIRTEFLETAVGRDSIPFIDAAGNEWTPKAYSDMLARTRLAETADIVMRQDMEDFGLDLVQVNDVNDTCPICEQYNGRYYSLTGKTEGFPVLEVRPPFHPNCLHDIGPVKDNDKYIDGYMRENKTLERRAAKRKAEWTEAERDQFRRHVRWNKQNR